MPSERCPTKSQNYFSMMYKYGTFIAFRLSWFMSVANGGLVFLMCLDCKKSGEGRERWETQEFRFLKSIPLSSNHSEDGGHGNSRYEGTMRSDSRNQQHN